MISIGIIGGSGYTGRKLIQFCNAHPFINEYKVYGNKTSGQLISELHWHHLLDLLYRPRILL